MVRKDVGGAGAPLAPTLDPPLPVAGRCTPVGGTGSLAGGGTEGSLGGGGRECSMCPWLERGVQISVQENTVKEYPAGGPKEEKDVF